MELFAHPSQTNFIVLNTEKSPHMARIIDDSPFANTAVYNHLHRCYVMDNATWAALRKCILQPLDAPPLSSGQVASQGNENHAHGYPHHVGQIKHLQSKVNFTGPEETYHSRNEGGGELPPPAKRPAAAPWQHKQRTFNNPNPDGIARHAN